MSALLFDSHAHYYDGRFSRESGGCDTLLRRLFAENVGGIVNVGTDVETSRTVIAQAGKYPRMFAAVGIHPSDGQRYDDPDAALRDLRELMDTPEKRAAGKIVALGEIGLDYHYPDTNKPLQAALFDAQLDMAVELGLPVIVHDRDAHGDCFDAVCRHSAATGVFHSYSGSAEMARDLVRRGWYISFSGVATFKNAPRVREAIAAVPVERLLIETDCPYLAPHPHRGECNHSGLLHFTASAVAEVKGMGIEELIARTAQNARTLFGIHD